MSGKSNDEVIESVENGAVKGISDTLKKVSTKSEEISIEGLEESSSNGIESNFKAAGTNLPEKTGVWTKIKNVLFYEIKVELTPYQQKVEDEINEFLHQEITWKSVKNFLFKEIPITYKGKRVF